MVNPLYLLIPILLVLAAVAYGVIRALGQIWLHHRIRLALLERIQQNPQLLASFNELHGVLAEVPDPPRPNARQDYALTGFILTLIGIASALIGRSWRVGAAAVGLHLGGWICIALGIGLLIIGLLIRSLSRNLHK